MDCLAKAKQAPATGSDLAGRFLAGDVLKSWAWGSEPENGCQRRRQGRVRDRAALLQKGLAARETASPREGGELSGPEGGGQCKPGGRGCESHLEQNGWSAPRRVSRGGGAAIRPPWCWAPRGLDGSADFPWLRCSPTKPSSQNGPSSPASGQVAQDENSKRRDRLRQECWARESADPS